MRKLIFYTLFVSIFIACSGNKKPLPVQKMKVVKDSTIVIKKENIALYNKIFDLHKISKDEFYNSYNYYENHPNEMKILLDSISAYGIKKRDTLTNHLK